MKISSKFTTKFCGSQMRMVPEANVTRGIRGQKLFGVLREERGRGDRSESWFGVNYKNSFGFFDAGEKCCLPLSRPRQKLIDDLASRKKCVRGNVQGFDLLFLELDLVRSLTCRLSKEKCYLCTYFRRSQEVCSRLFRLSCMV